MCVVLCDVISMAIVRCCIIRKDLCVSLYIVSCVISHCWVYCLIWFCIFMCFVDTRRPCWRRDGHSCPPTPTCPRHCCSFICIPCCVWYTVVTLRLVFLTLYVRPWSTGAVFRPVLHCRTSVPLIWCSLFYSLHLFTATFFYLFFIQCWVIPFWFGPYTFDTFWDCVSWLCVWHSVAIVTFRHYSQLVCA